MYILHSHRKKSHVVLTLAAVLLFLAGGAYLAKSLLHAETDIGPAPAAVVTRVADKRPAQKAFEMPQYSLNLPNDWESYKPAESLPAGAAAWHNTAKDKGVQSLVVYIDSPVQELAVNRVLPVEVINSSRLAAAGSISDNCTNFTTPTAEQTGKGKAPSKWQNVQFICDIGNYVRQVAGIAVTDNINSVSMTGPTGAKHSVFITYNDTRSNPDYETFNQAVNSFKLN